MRLRADRPSRNRLARRSALGVAAALSLACSEESPRPPLPQLPPASGSWSAEEARRAASALEEIAAVDARALPRLSQRSSDPAADQLFQLAGRQFVERCLRRHGSPHVLVCMDITRRLVAVYAGAVDREPALAPELLFLATEMLATSASQLAQWSRDVATFPADPENDRLSSELRGRLEELVATCVLWIGDTGLDDTGLDDTAQRQLAGRLVWALGPALAARTGMLESPESCAAIERARSATRDGEVREHLDALARGGRCR